MSRDASPREIKRAYRRLARELHPDVNPAPDADAQFKRLVEAFEAVSDPKRRPSPAARKGGPPREYLERFTDAVERAEVLLFRALLPRYASLFRGAGAELAAALAQDVVGSDLVAAASRGTPSLWARARAWVWARRMEVVIDYAPAWDQVRTRRPWWGGRYAWQFIVYPDGFWESGVRDPMALDDAVATRLALAMAAAMAIEAGFRGSLRGPEARAAAREHDDHFLWRRRGRIAFWLLVALACASLLYAGFTRL